jgi:ATP-binding cassette subfamily B protein
VPDVETETDEVLGRGFDRRLVRRLAQAARPHARVILASGLLFPLVAGVELLQPYLLKVAIDDHILKGDWRGLTRVVGTLFASLLVLYVLRAAEDYLMYLSGQRVIHDLRATLFAHLLRLEAAFFDRTPVGRLMTRVLSDVEAVGEAFTSGLFAVIGDVVVLAGVVGVMLWLDWRLALVTFALVPVLVLIVAWFRTHARDAYREVRRRLARLNGFLQESISGMTVIQLFGRERHEAEGFRALNADYRRAVFRSTVWDASLYAAVEALGSAALALLLWYGARQIAAEALTFGTLVAFIQYTNRFFLPIRDLGAKYTVMQSAMASSERIFGLLDREPAIIGAGGPLRLPPDPPGARRPASADVIDHNSSSAEESAEDGPRASGGSGGSRRGPPDPIVFENVWFAYDGDRWVLRDCSFEVREGERVAIVGATGEGKSTCARLLNRFYDVGRGRVLVDGVDVREWNLERLRRRVGVIFQDTVLFTGTVEANLRLGADGQVSAADLERAVSVANASGLVAALPRGLSSELIERGGNLSHGERQLLAIARAVVYNPAILVLDEATSSVDPESELFIRQALARLSEGRTTITIAHRLSTVQDADRILVLHRGHVAEEGRHGELIRRGGLYARLWELGTRARSA